MDCRGPSIRQWELVSRTASEAEVTIHAPRAPHSKGEEERSMRKLIWFLAAAITFVVVIAAIGLLFLKTRANGFSARAQPSALEEFAALTARSMALPPGAKEKRNPIANSAEILADAR